MCALYPIIFLLCLGFFACTLVAVKTALIGRDDGQQRETGIRPFLIVLPALLTSVGLILVLFFAPKLRGIQLHIPYVTDIKNTVETMPPWMGVLLAVGVVIGLMYFGRCYNDARVKRWATSFGLTVVSYKGTPFWKNPWGVNQSEYQTTFTVTVRDSQNKEATAFLRFGDYWGMDPGRIDVEWEGENNKFLI